MSNASPRPLSSKKLLDSKWTACHPVDKAKHFLVTRVFKATKVAHESEASGLTSDLMLELEAILSKKRRVLLWRELKNPDEWRPGWN